MEKQLDSHETIASYSAITVVVLGNQETRDYEIVDVAVPLPPETAADFHTRGLCHYATFGLLNGQFCSAFSAPLDAGVVSKLAQAFLELCLTKLASPKPKSDDSERWLERLFALPDLRQN